MYLNKHAVKTPETIVFFGVDSNGHPFIIKIYEDDSVEEVIVNAK